MTSNALNITDDGLPIFAASTGDFAAVELTLQGDILTRTLTDYAALGVGTNGKVLVPDSAAATGLNYDTKSAGSSVDFLESQTASASSSVDFTSAWDDSTYLYYIFTYTNVSPVTDGVELRWRVSVNGGSSYLSSNYRWVFLRLSSSSGSDSISENDSDSKVKMCTNLGNAAGEGLSGKALFFPSLNPGSQRGAPFLHDNTYVRKTGILFRNFGGAMNKTSSAVNGIRFFMSSGNISSGVFKMYGVSKS